MLFPGSLPLFALLPVIASGAFIFGNPEGFKTPGEGAFWPKHRDPKGALNAIYMGGIIVPTIIRNVVDGDCFLH
jgi:biopolymer transport protein ExbB